MAASYIGRHSDNIENKVIVTVSLGADRSWIMERKSPRKKARVEKEETEKVKKDGRWRGQSARDAGPDAEVLYARDTQGVKVKTPRISITFRQLVYDD